MRKITSLLMLLCVFVGTAWAQTSITDVAKLSNSKLYYLKSERGSLVYNEANPNILCSTAAYSSIGAESDAAKWAVYKYKNNYYFYTYAGEKFVGKSTGQFPLNVNSADPVSIYESGSTKGYPFAFSFNGTGTIDQYNHDAAPGVAYWSNGMNNKNDGGTAHMIIEAGDMPDGLEALIKSKLMEIEVAPVRSAMQTVGKRVGGYVETEASAAVKAALAKFDADGGQTEENISDVLSKYQTWLETPGSTEKVTLTEGEIFTLKCIDNTRGYLVYSQVSGKGSETEPWVANTNWPNVHPEVDDADVYSKWAYITIEGSNYLFNVEKKAYVKALGSEMVGFSGNGTAFELINEADDYYNFKMGSSYLASAASWQANHPVRVTGKDDGTRFWIDKVGESIDATLRTEMEEAFNRGYTCEDWKNAKLYTLGYVGGYAKSEQANIEAINDFAGIDAFTTANTDKVITLQDGGYYFLQTAKNQNAGQGTYMSYSGTDCYVYELGADEKLGAQHVWQFNASTDGGYNLQSCNLGTYLKTVAAGAVSTITSDIAAGSKYEFTVNDFTEITIKDDDEKVLRTEDKDANGKAKVNQWTEASGVNKNTNATWYIIPAEELNVSVDQYATIHLPFAVALSEGFEAYGVTNVSTSYATMSEAKTEIPANTGAILKGDGQCTLTIKDATTAWGNNALEGTNVVTYLPKQAYILSGDGENIGFYRALLNMDENGQVVGEETGTCFKNGANKAYLPAGENPGRFLNFDFGGTETGIEGIEGAEENAASVVYDLSGRRVQNAQRGIYIVNGKKVIK